MRDDHESRNTCSVYFLGIASAATDTANKATPDRPSNTMYWLGVWSRSTHVGGVSFFLGGGGGGGGRVNVYT